MKKIVFIIILLSILAACSLQNPTNPRSAQQTQVALFADATSTTGAAEAQVQMTLTAMAFTPSPTATRIPPTATPVPPTATTIPPTATNVPTTAPGQAIRLSFASGTTNITAEGQLAANAIKRYVFWADKSQLMYISSSGAYIAVTSPSGKKIVDFDQNWTWYRDYISEEGDWYIDLKAGNYATNYSLYLAIQ